MSVEIRVEKIINVASRSEQTELKGIVRLDHSRVKASGEKRGRSERSKDITEREGKRSAKIRSESEKSSLYQSGASSVLHNNAERGKYPI